MKVFRLKGRVLVGSVEGLEGEALVSQNPISFYGGVDVERGVIVERGHSLEGQAIAGKILVFPHGKGSTVGSYSLYALARRRLAPKVILNREAEPVVASGCVFAGIPLMDMFNVDPVRVLQTGDRLKFYGDGTVEVYREN